MKAFSSSLKFRRRSVEDRGVFVGHGNCINAEFVLLRQALPLG